jgi:hypothetical protein
MSFGQDPYQPSGFNPQPSFAQSGQVAASKVKAPAIALIVLAVLYILLLVVDLVGRIFNLASGEIPNFGNQNLDPQALYIGAVIGAVLSVVFIALQVVVIIGSLKMISLSNYRMAMTTAVLSVIPCVSGYCIIGIPFGIWALVLLKDPVVKAAFRS